MVMCCYVLLCEIDEAKLILILYAVCCCMLLRILFGQPAINLFLRYISRKEMSFEMINRIDADQFQNDHSHRDSSCSLKACIG